MTRTQISLLGALVVSSFSLAGCNREGEFSPVDMWNRSRYKPLEPTAQSQGASTSRGIPAGTVYRGQIERDKLYPPTDNGMSVRQMQEVGRVREAPDTPANMGVTGDYRVRGAGATMTKFPFPVTKTVLERGKERYEIYCAPCHGKTGAGDGMIVRRGFPLPPTYHQKRLREAPVGHFFDVITNGYGAMYPYAGKVEPEDRWAIVAYIRALQLSQNAKMSDVPANERANIGKLKPKPKSTPGHGAGHGAASEHSQAASHSGSTPAAGTPGDTGFDEESTKPNRNNRTDPATAN
jgi:mono/diheme cytochrome c family protein